MTVFVVQQQTKLSDDGMSYVPKFDVRPAMEYGDVCFLLSPTASPKNMDSILSELNRKLDLFSDDDFILLTGNPVLLGLVTAIAADRNLGNVKFLQWSGGEKGYAVVEANDIFRDLPPVPIKA